eukprot:Tbor_TRINITY_DN2899_c0_g1::TRINITY_DN2899_c0_g1_i1::g.23234::m.23234
MSDDIVNADELRYTIQCQADTIETLHKASSRYRTRLEKAEKEILEKDAEIGSLSVLKNENKVLREEILSLHDSIKALEKSTFDTVINNNPLSDPRVGVRLQAYQRHNSYLQSELSDREQKLKVAIEKRDIMEEENDAKERRISVLIEKLREHNIVFDGVDTDVSSIRISANTLHSTRLMLKSQASTIDLLYEKIDATTDEIRRKQNIIDAIQGENKALRLSVSKLIAQITGCGHVDSGVSDEETGSIRRAVAALTDSSIHLLDVSQGKRLPAMVKDEGKLVIMNKGAAERLEAFRSRK